MQLLAIRHAIASDRDAFARTGKDDALRPVTREGARKMKAAARGLRRLVDRIDVIAASPLTRAQQTASIVAEAYGELPTLTVPALAPDSNPEALARWLRQQSSAAVVAVVGHEPHMGEVVTWFMTGHEESRVAFRKGGACLLELGKRARAGEAVLQWALTPSQLRRLGR